MQQQQQQNHYVHQATYEGDPPVRTSGYARGELAQDGVGADRFYYQEESGGLGITDAVLGSATTPDAAGIAAKQLDTNPPATQLNTDRGQLGNSQFTATSDQPGPGGYPSTYHVGSQYTSTNGAAQNRTWAGNNAVQPGLLNNNTTYATNASGSYWGPSAAYPGAGGTSSRFTSAGVSGGGRLDTQNTSVAGGRSTSDVSRVVGHEYGPERIISVTQHVDESRSHIVNEHYIEHEVRVPKRIVREEIIEKVIVVPEKVVQEEIIEEKATIREKIVEIARPIIIEKVIEVPEYEYVEKIVEVPEKIIQERVVPVDKVEYKDRVQHVTKVIPQERIVEVPDVQYREIPVERVVEVPEWREEVIIKQVPVPQYVDKPVPNVVQVEQAVDVERQIPIPLQADITYEFRLPRIKPRYHKITYPVYLPRFIEIPVALELFQGSMLQESEMYLQQVGSLTQAAASLCEIENLATTIMRADLQSRLSTTDLQNAIMKSWREGTLNVQHFSSHQYTETEFATTIRGANPNAAKGDAVTHPSAYQTAQPASYVASSVTPSQLLKGSVA